MGRRFGASLPRAPGSKLTRAMKGRERGSFGYRTHLKRLALRMVSTGGECHAYISLDGTMVAATVHQHCGQSPELCLGCLPEQFHAVGSGQVVHGMPSGCKGGDVRVGCGVGPW